MPPKDDPEEQRRSANIHEAETRLGSSRDIMWSLYMKQAGAFDRNMVEDWKGVMEGTLIFAGLFSAVVTAFMIESLRRLTLERTPNASLSTDPFAENPTYLAISALWSLSLAFSMGCAISATLVQQWARSYLHAVDNQHHPPHKRALIRAYMYEGMERSHMTFAIEGIPILLHMALFLFLIGLIVYFHSIDPLISYPIMAVFIVSTTMYLIPTYMPLVRSNFPFHTPLSSPNWWVWRVVWHREPLRSAQTMETIRERDATHNNRNERGYQAISWILSQSDEDREFEQFLDAIAGYKGGFDPLGGRVQVARLVENHPSETLLRTYTMLRSCGRFSRKLDNRVTVILHAIPALAMSWSIAREKWEVPGPYLSLWPLQMLKVLNEEAVAGNKAALDSDLVISAYHILLHIALQTLNTQIAPGSHVVAQYDPPEILEPNHVVKANAPPTEDLDIDHDIDNIKAARELIPRKYAQHKSTNTRPFDMITNVLVSSAFHDALLHALRSPRHCATSLGPYITMLHFLCKEGDPQLRFSTCTRELLQNSSFRKELPDLCDDFLRNSALIEDEDVIANIALPTIKEYLNDNPNDTTALKTKKTLDEKLLRFQSPSPATTRPPSHKEFLHLPFNPSYAHFHNHAEGPTNNQTPFRVPSAEFLASAAPPLASTGHKHDSYDVGTSGVVSQFTGKTLIPGDDSEYFPPQESGPLPKSSPDTMNTDLNRESFDHDYTRTARSSMAFTTTTSAITA